MFGVSHFLIYLEVFIHLCPRAGVCVCARVHVCTCACVFQSHPWSRTLQISPWGLGIPFGFRTCRVCGPPAGLLHTEAWGWWRGSARCHRRASCNHSRSAPRSKQQTAVPLKPARSRAFRTRPWPAAGSVFHREEDRKPRLRGTNLIFSFCHKLWGSVQVHLCVHLLIDLHSSTRRISLLDHGCHMFSLLVCPIDPRCIPDGAQWSDI